MKKKHFALFLITFLLFTTAACNKKSNKINNSNESSDSAVASLSQQASKKSDLVWTNPYFNYQEILSIKQLEIFGHALPIRFFKDKEGKSWLAGWENFVNFSIDKDCSDKFYYYEIMLDSAMAHLKQSKYSDPYFSPNDYFDSIGKSMIKKEVNHQKAKNGLLFEMNDIHLYFKGKRNDSVVVYQSTVRNIFDKEIELKSIVINLGSRPVDKVFGTLTIKETSSLKDTNTLNQNSYSNINLLEKTLPPYSIQMAKKSIPNKYSSANKGFRYYNDNWTYTSYQIANSTETIQLKDK